MFAVSIGAPSCYLYITVWCMSRHGAFLTMLLYDPELEALSKEAFIQLHQLKTSYLCLSDIRDIGNY